MEKAAKAARMADQIRDYMALWTHQRLPGLLFSVVDVTLTPDLRSATIWLEINSLSEVRLILETLEKDSSLRQNLHRALGKKFSPRLTFRDIGFTTQTDQNLL